MYTSVWHNIFIFLKNFYSYWRNKNIQKYKDPALVYSSENENIKILKLGSLHKFNTVLVNQIPKEFTTAHCLYNVYGYHDLQLAKKGPPLLSALT